METLPTNLPVLPCYSNEKCGQVFNCGLPNECQSNTVQGELANCPSGLQEEYCYGNNSNYCSGIYARCDSNDIGEGINCQPGVTPAKTLYGQNLGCDLKNDINCFEFEKSSPCQSTCWTNGGNIEVQNVCKTITEPIDCKGINFCKWNGYSCNSVLNDPSSSINTGIKILSNGNKVYCANSSYSSVDTTTQDDNFNIKTCCIGNKCITTPRCEFVEHTCDCVFKDISYENNPVYNVNSDKNNIDNSFFMCYDIINNHTSLDSNGNSVTRTKNGYCSWCSGAKLNKVNNKSCSDRCSALGKHELNVFKFKNNLSTDTIPSSIYFNKCMNNIDPLDTNTSPPIIDFCVTDNLDPKVLFCQKSYIDYLKNISGCELDINTVKWTHICQNGITNNFACGSGEIENCKEIEKIEDEDDDLDPVSIDSNISFLEEMQEKYGIHVGNTILAFIIIIPVIISILFIYYFRDFIKSTLNL